MTTDISLADSNAFRRESVKYPGGAIQRFGELE